MLEILEVIWKAVN